MFDIKAIETRLHDLETALGIVKEPCMILTEDEQGKQFVMEYWESRRRGLPFIKIVSGGNTEVLSQILDDTEAIAFAEGKKQDEQHKSIL